MATRTTNYGLYKPEPTDPTEDFLTEFGYNMDEIDSHLGGGGGGGDSVTWTQIQQSGIKIAEIEINGAITDVYAPQGAPPFTALIIITADTGSTITATKGADTYTATEVTTGQYEVTVDSIGTWTISDGTLSDTVTVTAQTTYYVTLSAVPDGRTVLPTDDIQIWLHCANIWDKTYTTLGEVLADTTTLLALINSPNAVDYMVRSTTWVSDITANQSAMSYIGLNNYCANTLLADSTWRSAICNSAYFESVLNVKVPTMTSNTTPSGVASYSGGTIQNGAAFNVFDNDVSTYLHLLSNNLSTPITFEYQFDAPHKIIMATVYPLYINGAGNCVKNYKIQGYDGNSWLDLCATQTMPNVSSAKATVVTLTSNLGNYAKYRLMVNDSYYIDPYTSNKYIDVVRELQFYGREDI